jgi:hypothetical protein
MRILRVAAWLVALGCFLTVTAWAADLDYSGVPGKWKRGAKGKAAESGSKTPAKEVKKEAPQERTITITMPEDQMKPKKIRKEP